MAKVRMDLAKKKCMTPVCRISFPAVFKPKQYKGQEPKYELTMLFKKDTDLTALRRAYKNAAKEAWGSDESAWPKHRRPIRDADKDPKKLKLKGYKGHYFVVARAKVSNPPQVIDREKNPIDEKSGEFYAGCYARATLIAFSYGGEDGIKEGIGFSLQNILKVKDGEKFSGKPDAEDEFKDIEVEDEEEDSDNYDDESSDDDEDGGW